MKTQWTLLLTAGLSVATGVLPRAEAANLHPLVATGLGGEMRITLSLPAGCGNVDKTTGVSGGVLALTPSDGIGGGGARTFTLTRADVAFTPFTIHRSCYSVDVTREYTRVAVQLAHAVTFTAPASGSALYAITIPPEDVLVYQDVVVNGSTEPGESRPVQDVTGTLDLAHGTVQLNVAFGVKVHLQGGCVPVLGCAVNEDRIANVTAVLGGRFAFPDSDGDGIPDKDDNCVLTANPDQRPVATPVIQTAPTVPLTSCAHRILPPFAADLCDAVLVEVAGDQPPVFPPGRTVVTWTATDLQGRSAGAAQVVNVVDTTAPVFTSVPGDVVMADCGLPRLGQATATDDCGSAPTLTNNAPARFLVGKRVVTWTATDTAGNRSTAGQVVTVTDTVAPTLACLPTPDPVRLGRGTGFFKVSTADACGVPVLRLGSYTLANRETINIVEDGRPGVILVNTVNGVRYFQVGPGEAVVTATDRSGNATSAICGAEGR